MEGPSGAKRCPGYVSFVPSWRPHRVAFSYRIGGTRWAGVEASAFRRETSESYYGTRVNLRQNTIERIFYNVFWCGGFGGVGVMGVVLMIALGVAVSR